MWARTYPVKETDDLIRNDGLGSVPPSPAGGTEQTYRHHQHELADQRGAIIDETTQIRIRMSFVRGSRCGSHPPPAPVMH